MSVRFRALVTAAVAVSAVGLGVSLTNEASAQAQICEQYGSTTVGGRYIVMNNRWGSPGPQCITPTDNGFTINQQDGRTATNGAPASYPAIFLGCHYTACTPNSPLPVQISAANSITSQIGFSYVQNATYDAAYDIWLDPTPKKDGVNKTEIMIWFNHTGGVQPVGSAKGNATVGGRTWTVWTGNNGGNDVVSYVAPAAIGSWNFDVKDFVKDTISRGFATDAWYVTSIQAGFEPWAGGAGLAVTAFSATVNGGAAGGGGSQPVTPPTQAPTTGPTPTPTPPTTGGPLPTETGAPGSGAPGSAAPGSGTPATNAPGSGATAPAGLPQASACRVTYQANHWPGGFVANVSVAGSAAPANGWSLNFTLPSGQTITHSWNAALSGTSGNVTAKNVAHNAAIRAQGSQHFGFLGTSSGAFASPTSFTLNGTRCTVG